LSNDAFYAEMAGIATELLEEFDQGTLRLARVVSSAADPDRPWDVTQTGPFFTDLNGTSKTVTSRFVDGTTVVATDIEVTFAPVALRPEPGFSDRIEIRGELYTTAKVKRIPESGTVVAWKFFVRR